MENLKTNFSLPWSKAARNLLVAFIVLAWFGFADASYLTIKHYLAAPVPCSLIGNCEAVLTSKYSMFFGIPVALFGSLYYLTLLILSLIYLDAKKSLVLAWLFRLSWVGVAFSLWFIFVQLFILKEICLYCMFSAVTSISLFLLAFKILRNKVVAA